MNVDTIKIKSLCDQLDSAKKSLDTAINARALLDMKGHQEPIYVCVGSNRIEVSYLDRSTGWESRVRPGREMILLGMIKVSNALIDSCKSKVNQIQAELTKAVNGQI